VVLGEVGEKEGVRKVLVRQPADSLVDKHIGGRVLELPLLGEFLAVLAAVDGVVDDIVVHFDVARLLPPNGCI